MAHQLNYAAPGVASRWSQRVWAAAWAVVPALGVAAAACLLSTVTVEIARQIEGQPTLDWLPWSYVYRACIEQIPAWATTALLPVALVWAVWREQRGDRLAVAALAALTLFCIWYGVIIVLFINGERAFP
jgi:hypothetical protein